MTVDDKLAAAVACAAAPGAVVVARCWRCPNMRPAARGSALCSPCLREVEHYGDDETAEGMLLPWGRA